MNFTTVCKHYEYINISNYTNKVGYLKIINNGFSANDIILAMKHFFISDL
jgi:hypothetical protein